MTAAPRILERDIERTCTDFLELDGWRSLKTDPVSRREWGKGFGEKGMADHLYIRYGRFNNATANPYRKPGAMAINAQVLWIEFKRRGGKAAAHQKAWHARERARGALTLILGEDCPASIEGFREFYMKSGLARRVY